MAKSTAKIDSESRQRMVWIAVVGLLIAGCLYLLVGKGLGGPKNEGSGKYYYTGPMVPHGMAVRPGPPTE